MQDAKLERAMEAARRYETIKSFRAENPAMYNIIHRRGVSDAAFSHMRRIRVTQEMYAAGRFCTSCLNHQPIEEFLPVSHGSSRRRAICKSCHCAQCSEWRAKNIERSRAIASLSAKNNPQTAREAKRRQRQMRPEAFAARDMLKRILRLTGERKSRTTESLLGYTAVELRSHIESRFRPGMSWDNWGEWHIDHIEPVSKLVSSGVTEPSEINALSNLQPLWASENIAKRAKVGDEHCLYPVST